MSGMPLQDGILLVKATLKMYRGALADAWRGSVINWRAVLIHVAGIVAVSLFIPLASLLGPLLGGFALGILLALFLSVYFFTVAAGVERERIDFGEVRSHGFQLFSPLISVLFFLYIINFLADRMLGSPDMAWVRMCINLFVTVLFNPLPEVIYNRGGIATEMFAVSLEFIKENFVEWLLPALLFVLLIALATQSSFLGLLVLLATNDPLHLIEESLFSLAGMRLFFWLTNPLSVVYVVLFLYGLYFVCVFRGALYKRLSGSTRRKRIYQERMGIID